MRIALQLITENNNCTIPVNYQYPLSAAIYKIISRADSEYATFLHDSGYKKQDSLKTFKLFTFSDLKTPFKITGDRLILNDTKVQLILCFHIPEAASHFVRGLFLHQQIEIADHKSKTVFFVQQVEVQPPPFADKQPDEIVEATLQPASPLTIALTSNNGHYEFIRPDDERFAPALFHHWKEKYSAVYGNEAAGNEFGQVEITVINVDKARSRLVTIKANTPQETKIRGFTHFRLQVKAPLRAIELALNAGISIYSSMGFSCVEIVKSNSGKNN